MNHEDKTFYYDTLDNYILYHNTDRLHFLLDIDNYTLLPLPLKAFLIWATQGIRATDP